VTTSDRLRRTVTDVRITAVHDGVRSERPDTLATEEPMEIRVGGPRQAAQAVAVTMRTPGADYELAVGFLFTEGLIAPGEVRRVAYCDDLDDEEQRYNVVTVSLDRLFDHERLHRNFFATSSCGICGKAALDDVEVRCAPVAEGPEVRADVLVSLPERLRSRQRVFDRTGGLHAAALCTPGGDIVSLREDVGRHNAVDKVIGEQVLAGRIPLAGSVLQVSGRASFEIVQKAAVAGIPIVSAVSAPSSLGFVRDGRCNVYTGAQRVVT
jgi:FdhD protein